MTSGSSVPSYVAMQHCPGRIGDDQDMPAEEQFMTGVKTYPDGPDGHDALHVTFALGHCPEARRTTIA